MATTTEADIETLDAAQREVASTWEDNCRTEDATACLAEPTLDFLVRWMEKLELLASYVVKPQLEDGALPYAYATDQASTVPDGIDLEIPTLSVTVAPMLGDAPALATEASQHLRESGLVLLKGAVGKAACDQALRYLMTLGSQPRPKSTEEVQAARHRHHFRLRFQRPELAPALRGLLAACRPPLEALLTGNGRLVELAGFLTNPGAHAQDFHTDANPSDAAQVAPYYTALLFLTDVAAEGGRFEAVPRSHALSPHRELLRGLFNRSAEDMPAERQAAYEEELRAVGIDATRLDRAVAANAGDVLVYDGSLVHRGSGNRAARTRGAVYMTFLGQGEEPGGPTIAIHSEFLQPPRGPISLAQLSKELSPASS